MDVRWNFAEPSERQDIHIPGPPRFDRIEMTENVLVLKRIFE